MFAVSDKVICVDAKFPGWVHDLYQQLPKQSRTYTVRAVRLGRGNPVNEAHMPGCGVKPGDQDGEILVLLEEIRNGADPHHMQHAELGFKAERFRKIEEKVHENVESYSDSYAPEVPGRHASGAGAGRATNPG